MQLVLALLARIALLFTLGQGLLGVDKWRHRFHSIRSLDSGYGRRALRGSVTRGELDSAAIEGGVRNGLIIIDVSASDCGGRHGDGRVE